MDDMNSGSATAATSDLMQKASSGSDTLSPVLDVISGLSLDSGVPETKTEQARATLAGMQLEKEMFSRHQEEIGQRLDDVAKILRQIQLKEEKFSITNNAIDTRMDSMGKMLLHLEQEKNELVRWRRGLQDQQDINSKQTEKLEHRQKAFEKQSDLLVQLMRQQHQMKSDLDSREHDLKSREDTLALRDLAVKKGEITLIHREQALKAYEHEVQKQINAYLQD